MKNKKGFTLIEIVVTLTILVLLLGVVAATTVLTQRFSTGEYSRVELQNEVRIALAWIDRDVRSSNQIAINDDSCFILISGTNVRYCLVGDTLTRNDQTIAENLVNFSYTIDPTSSTLVVSLTTIADRYGNPVSLTDTYYLRDGRSN
jgi:prepilin-type N-terminal cleavage/methylation domain-containing protein